MDTCEALNNKAWKNFFRRHWKATLLMIVGIVLAIAVAIFVFLGVVADAQSTGLVPAMLGEWTVGYSVIFVLTLVFWELVLVGSWVFPIALITYFVWYKRLPSKERKEYERNCGKSKNNCMSILATLIWLVIVRMGGKWDLAFQSWTFNDWVFSWLAAGLWVLLIFVALGTVFVVWSLAKK